MKKTFSLLLIATVLFTAQQASAESWLSKTFGPNGSAFKMLGASVMNITSIDSVQRKLIDTGVLKSTVTGVADEQTIQAVKTFQATNNLKVDGVVGKETLKLLDPVAAASIIKPNLSTIKADPIDPWKLKCVGLNGQAPQPQIEVLSPNGGETFTPGQQITVKWRSCNIQNFPGANTSAVSILLKQQSTGVRYALTPNANPQYGYGGFTQNDGSEVVALPTLSTFPVTPIAYGTDFKVIVTLVAPYPPIEANNGAIYDESNSLFTIGIGNSSIGSTVTLNNSSIQTTTSNTGSTQYINYNLNIAVTNNDSSDYYIPQTVGWNSYPGFEFGIFNSNNTEVSMAPGGNVASSVTSLAPVVGNGFYKIAAKTTQYFNVSVAYQAPTSGYYKLKVKNVRGTIGSYPGSSQPIAGPIVIAPNPEIYSSFALFVK